MKKNYVLPMIAAIALAVGTSSTMALAQQCPYAKDAKPPIEKGKFPPAPPHKKMSPEQMEKMKKEHEKRKAEFDARLKLTDAQKKQMELNRQEDAKKMEPLFKEMKVKKDKIREIKASNLSDEEKAKQIAPVKAELKALKVKMHEIREENLKQFEALLTDKQKKELAKMKEERKKNSEKFKKGGHKKFDRPCPIPPKTAPDKK